MKKILTSLLLCPVLLFSCASCNQITDLTNEIFRRFSPETEAIAPTEESAALEKTTSPETEKATRPAATTPEGTTSEAQPKPAPSQPTAADKALMEQFDFKINASTMTCEITNYKKNDANVVIPEKFRGCTVTAIGERAFYAREELTSVEMPDTVCTIGKYAFAECRDLMKFNFPKSLKTIEERAFYKCFSFRSVILPTGLTTIGNQAFYHCLWMYEAVIPGTVTDWGSECFAMSQGLTYLTLDPGLRSIGVSAFEECDQIAKIWIPETVQRIGARAFYCSNHASELHFGGNAPTDLGRDALGNPEADAKIYYDVATKGWDNPDLACYTLIGITTKG